MDHDVDFSADVLRRLTDDGTTCVKRVAHLLGVTDDTIYAYRDGKIRIPMTLWRVLWRETRDMRIPMMIFDGTPTDIVCYDHLPDLASDKSALQSALDSMALYHETQSQLASILADGRVDETDAVAIGRFQAARAQSVLHDAAIHQAIVKMFNAATAPKDRKR